jgi:hypothetical protein
LTKIKIIGDPGQWNINNVKNWFEEAIQNLHLEPAEIWCVFIKLEEEDILEQYMEKKFSFEEKLLPFSAMYLPKKTRKEGIPPVFAINKKEIPKKERVFHETTHLKAEKIGWQDIINKAIDLVIPKRGIWIPEIPQLISDYYARIIMGNYGLDDISKSEIKEFLDLLKSLKKFDNPVSNFFIMMRAAFFLNLPFVNKHEFQKEIDDFLQKTAMKGVYSKMGTIVSRLGNEPEISKICKCITEIFSLFQDFLEE